MNDKHQVFAEHFTALANARCSFPVFVIEHGFDAAELADLKSTVALQLELDPHLERAAWTSSYLPLLVIATEVGYRYRGTGTDFWPVLFRELGVEAGPEFRAGTSRLFELGHRSFRLARPGNSAWERQFPHIAWPIGNALVPLEIQPQLTDALRRAIRAGIAADDTKALFDYLTTLAAGHASRRFENWLRQRETALEVMRRLLTPESDGWLSQSFLRRIDSDLRKDLGAFRAISEARRISARRVKHLSEFPPSRFVLSLVDGTPGQLLIRGPVLSSERRNEAIAALRIQGDRIRAEGAGQSILLRSFLAGNEIAIGPVGHLPNAPLRRGDASHATEGLASTVLGRLQPREATFFLIEPGECAAHAVFPKEILAPDVAVLQMQRINHNDSPEFRRLETSLQADATLLQKNSFTILERKPTLRVLGLPMPGTQLKFTSGFPVVALPKNADIDVLLDNKHTALGSFRIKGADWAIFQPCEGAHWLGPTDADDHERIAFDVIEPPDVEPACITILPVGATMADIQGGRLEIIITAPLPLESVPVRLHLLSSDQPDVIVEDIFDCLPVRIAGRSPLMEKLLSQLEERHSDIVGLRLKIEVSGLLSSSIVLPPVHRELHYNPASGQWAGDSDEDRNFSSLIATPQAPLPDATADDVSGFRLVLPDAPEHESLRAGLIISGRASMHIGSQEAETVVLPQLLREAETRAGRAGLVDVVRATVAWKLAEAGDLISDWRRRSVADCLEGAAIGLFCGPSWRELETDIDLSILSQHGALLRSAQSFGLVSGVDLPQIEPGSDRAFLEGRLLARLGEVVPDVGDALARWDEELGGDLDLAVIDAYEDLRRHLQDTDHIAFDEVDMSREAKAWHTALTQARNMPLLPMFQCFILPEARWSALMNPWYHDLTKDDLVDLLDACHVDASRRPGQRWLGRPELRAMLQLWLSPQSMIDVEDWAQLLSKGLADMQTARAVRYVALRWKLARLDMPDRTVA